jgi:hypothetical protein
MGEKRKERKKKKEEKDESGIATPQLLPNTSID